MDTNVNWTFNMVDNVSGTTKQMADAQQQLSQTATETKRSVDSQNISFMTQVVAVSAVYHGISRMTSSLNELGIISDQNAASLNKMNAAVGMVVGSFQLLKGATQIIKMLTTAEIGLAAVESFRAVLNSPAKAALVGAGIGLAAGVGAVLLSSSGGSSGGSQTNVYQTVNFGSGSTAERSSARDSFESMGGF